MKSDYEERKERRINRMRESAERKRLEAAHASNRSKQMLEAIPFGQPIMIGHHSEKRDRRYRDKAWNLLGKAAKSYDEASAMEQRADSAESNTAISSDDPEAISKLKEKLEHLEQKQKKMVSFNKAMRKDDRETMVSLVGEENIESLLKEDSCGRTGYPDYALKNNNANIRRVRQRIGFLEKLEEKEDKETVIGDIKVVENVSENRLQIFFPGKPSPEIIKALKGRGFRWARSIGAWQRHYTNSAVMAARDILKMAE